MNARPPSIATGLWTDSRTQTDRPSVSLGSGKFDTRGLAPTATGTTVAASMDDTRGAARPVRAGKVSLVGAGPGDAELLTVRAVRRIAQADAIVYDHLVGDGILELASPDALRIYAGKEAGMHALPQTEINRLLIELAQQGRKVVRLKGGDPFIFGRGGEEMQALIEAGIDCEVVPGVTAASGMAACTGIPLTHRDCAQTLVFTTGHLKDGTVNLDWTTLARPHQTVVIYMGLGALEIICSKLIAHGLPADTPAAVVHAASTPRQRMVSAPVGKLADAVRTAGLRTPSLIVIGKVVEIARILQPVLRGEWSLAT